MADTHQQPHRRPPSCRYDRETKTRVVSRDGQPCTQIHCMVCTRVHHPNAGHPIAGVPDQWVCIDCVKVIKDDLQDIQACYTALAVEAQQGGSDGHLVAAAPIPGGVAQVLIGPSVRLDLMRTTKLTQDTLFRKDPIPPLAILRQWEVIYRGWLGHDQQRLASVARAIAYLHDQVPYLADHHQPNPAGVPAPGFKAFTRQIRNTRAALERALHDEREPEYGVECFECGEQLVRRFRDPKRCRHATPARDRLARQMRGRVAALVRLAWLAEDPKRGKPSRAEEQAALLPTPVEMAAARLPCPECSQGGLDDPRAGRSWECPGCRKEYDVGEYHTAVRRDLLANEDAWTTITDAVRAASTMTGCDFSEVTIRSWIGRDWVRSRREPQKSGIDGRRLVHWPDVKREALRFAAGLQHCKHRTPARVWLLVLATYPELEPWDDEIEAVWEQCDACSAAVENGGRRARGTGVA